MAGAAAARVPEPAALDGGPRGTTSQISKRPADVEARTIPGHLGRRPVPVGIPAVSHRRHEALAVKRRLMRSPSARGRWPASAMSHPHRLRACSERWQARATHILDCEEPHRGLRLAATRRGFCQDRKARHATYVPIGIKVVNRGPLVTCHALSLPGLDSNQ